MNNLLILFTDGIITYLLITSLVATALTALVWTIIKLAKVQSPVYRHMIWLYTLIAIVSLPVIWLHGPKLILGILPAQTQSEEKMNSPQADVGPIAQIAYNNPQENYLSIPPATGDTASVKTSPSHSFSIKALLVSVWFFGVVFMFTRLFVGWYRLRRISLSAEPVSESEHFGNIFSKELQILLTNHIDSPVCFGIFNQVIILPRQMYKANSPEDLQMILSHEFAHIQRQDCRFNLLQRIIEAVFFFHPLIWYASFQLTQQREQICDNYVLARGVSKSDYVRLLSRIVEQGFERKHFHAVALFEGRLLSRIRSLLDSKHNGQIKASRPAMIISAAVMITCLAVGVIRLEAKTGQQTPYKDIFVNITDTNGNALADVSVEALSNYKPVGHAKTDRVGNAVLKVSESAGIIWIVALKSGEGFDYFEAYENTPFNDLFEDIPETVALVLDGARNISVRGVDSENNFVEGVPFVPWTIIKKDKKWHVNLSGSKIAQVSTNGNGLAVFDWFPAHTTEDISGTIRFGTTFMVQGGQYFWPDCEQKKPYREYSSEITARLLGNTSISGRVLHTDGSGAAGIIVRAEGRGKTPFFYRRETVTGSDGSYSLDVYPNQIYMVTVIDDKWASEIKSGIIVREKRPVRNIDLQLSKGTLITGQVTAESDDQSVAGELIFLSQSGSVLPEEFLTGGYSKKESLILTAKTDEAGRYTFRVAPGVYSIGPRPTVVHQGQVEQNLKIDSQNEIERNFQIKSTRLIGITAGIPYAHQEKVYDGAMVFYNCDYCHAPLNVKPKPRTAKKEDIKPAVD